MDVTVEPPPTTVTSAEGGSNHSVCSFKKVRVTKRNFTETVLAGSRLGNDDMDNAEDVDWLKDEVIVDSDVEDEIENYPLGIPVVKIPKDLRKEIVKPWKNALLLIFFGMERGRFLLAAVEIDLTKPLGSMSANGKSALHINKFEIICDEGIAVEKVMKTRTPNWKERDGASLNMWTDWWVGPKPLELEESFVILEELSSCKVQGRTWVVGTRLETEMLGEGQHLLMANHEGQTSYECGEKQEAL
nr:uncharacterized protein LOC109159424 [Ipomoea batatas]